MICKVISVLSAVTVLLLWTRDRSFNKDDIKGRNVVITGGSAGVGEQLAYQYAKLGANVFITARREKLLKQVVQNCKSLNSAGKYGYYVADMKMYKTESKILIQKAVQFLHGIDTLIVNHIYYGHLTVWHGTEEELDMFEEMASVNFNSYIHIASHALPYLKSARNGRLGIMSSILGKVPFLLYSGYCGFKFGLDGFFSTLREELAQAKTNVTVTLILQGATVTESADSFREDEPKRLGITPEFIVNTAEPFYSTREEAAEKVIQATETGTEELYHPTWFASRIPYPASWMAIARHIWPQLGDPTVLSEAFFKKHETG